MTQKGNVLEQEQAVVAPQIADSEYVVRTPAMDIVERKDDVVLAVDVPGVSEESLEINVENGLLTISGLSRPEASSGVEVVYRERQAIIYKRAVRLSDRLNPAGITAQLKQGVLQLAVPKREEVKPRRVTIAAN